jgi:hypothetical protein
LDKLKEESLKELYGSKLAENLNVCTANIIFCLNEKLTRDRSSIIHYPLYHNQFDVFKLDDITSLILDERIDVVMN